MAEFPAFPLWTDAYLADTMHLTAEQDGFYLRLLMLIWRSPDQRVPNDDEWLARRLRATPDEMQRIVRPIIQELCQNSQGNWIRQKRLTREWNYLKKRAEQRSAAAKSRWNKDKDICGDDTVPHTSRNAAPYTSRNAPTPTPTPTPIRKKDAPFGAPNGKLEKTTAPPDVPFLLPPGEPNDEEKALFQRGKAVLGKQAGGMIAQLLRAKGGKFPLARAAIETASTKENPREYIAACIRGAEQQFEGRTRDPRL